MMKIQLPCLLGGESCQFLTIQLEFSQAKEILEMHMKLVHPVPDCRKSKCDKCDRDNDSKDIIEDDDETSCNVPDESVCDVSKPVRDNSDLNEYVDSKKVS